MMMLPTSMPALDTESTVPRIASLANESTSGVTSTVAMLTTRLIRAKKTRIAIRPWRFRM